MPKTTLTLTASTKHCDFESADMPSKTAAEIGRRVADLRKHHGITQAQMAEKLGLAQSVVSDYERGELRLHGELILQLCDILKATPNEILGIDDVDAPKHRQLYKRVEAISELPKRDQEALLRTIDVFLHKAS